MVAAVSGSRLLIVEDEYFVAGELKEFFTSLGAKVLGPVPSMEAAADYVGEADAAILDVCLDGEVVFPLADNLIKRRIPFVFYTGHDDINIPERFRHAAYLSKPAGPEAVRMALFPADPHQDTTRKADADVLGAIPKLRLAARIHLGEAAAADRLVELTLQEALNTVRSKPRDISVHIWLGQLMENLYRRGGGRLLN